jgi:hypothetical protein
LTDTEVAEQRLKISCTIQVVVMVQGCEKQVFAELSGTNEELKPIRFPFEHFDIRRFVDITVVFGDNFLEITVPVRQKFDCIHNGAVFN